MLLLADLQLQLELRNLLICFEFDIVCFTISFLFLFNCVSLSLLFTKPSEQSSKMYIFICKFPGDLYPLLPCNSYLSEDVSAHKRISWIDRLYAIFQSVFQES